MTWDAFYRDDVDCLVCHRRSVRTVSFGYGFVPMWHQAELVYRRGERIRWAPPGHTDEYVYRPHEETDWCQVGIPTRGIIRVGGAFQWVSEESPKVVAHCDHCGMPDASVVNASPNFTAVLEIVNAAISRVCFLHTLVLPVDLE